MNKTTYIIFPHFGQNSNAMDILRDVSDIEIRKDKSRPSPEELSQLSKSFDGLIIGTLEKINRNTVPPGSKVKVVGILAKAIDNIDIFYCQSQGIKYINSTNSNSRAVAEFVFAQILFMFKSLRKSEVEVRKKNWDWRMHLETMELQNKTIGVIGAGEIGTEIIKIANAFKMKILCFTLNPNKHKDLILKEGVKFVVLEKLLREAHIISINTPYTKETESLISKNEIEKMRPDALLINTSRGSVVDESAIIEALKNTKIRGACIDVFNNEPKVNKEWFTLKNVLLTPHIAGLTSESWNRMEENVSNKMAQVFRNIEKV